MSDVGQREIRTQRRVIAFFQDALGYAYLGHWKDRPDNSNVEQALLTDWLERQDHSDKIIGKVLFELDKAAALGGSKTLYAANREVYGLLRYGVKVKPDVGEQTITVWLIDWAHAASNDFANAEESEKLSAFDDLTLVQMIVERGEQAVEALPKGLRENHEAMAETIENNVRRLIIDEMAVNPKYYEKMSELLDALIAQRKQQAMDYKAYLARIVELTKTVCQPEVASSYPSGIDAAALRALYDNLDLEPRGGERVDGSRSDVHHDW